MELLVYQLLLCFLPPGTKAEASQCLHESHEVVREQQRQLLLWHYNAESMRQVVFAYIVMRFHMGDTADLGAGVPFWHHVHQPPIVVGWRGDHTQASRRAQSHLFEFVEFEEGEEQADVSEVGEETGGAGGAGGAEEEIESSELMDGIDALVEERRHNGANPSLPLRPQSMSVRSPRNPLRHVS